MGMALWGTVIGAVFGGIPAERYGRRKTLIAVGIPLFRLGDRLRHRAGSVTPS